MVVRSLVYGLASVLLLSAAFPAAAAAPTVVDTGMQVSPPPTSSESCDDGTVKICDITVPVHGMPLNAGVILNVPSPYMHEFFTVNCVKNGGQLNLQITDQSGVTCAAQVCTASNVKLCGASIPVPGGTLIGATVEVPVPPRLLVDPSMANGLTITAACGDNGSAVSYAIKDSTHVSCNLFPCPASSVKLCNSNIPVAGGAAMGAALHLTAPLPYVADPYTVQCIGRPDGAPAYQLTDASAVTCKLRPAAQ